MNLWLARAEGLTAHLLWRLSNGRLNGNWLQRSPTPGQVDMPDADMPPDATPSFSRRIAELQREAELPPATKDPAPGQRELSTGMFIVVALVVMTLAIGSFFL